MEVNRLRPSDWTVGRVAVPVSSSVTPEGRLVLGTQSWGFGRKDENPRGPRRVSGVGRGEVPRGRVSGTTLTGGVTRKLCPWDG